MRLFVVSRWRQPLPRVAADTGVSRTEGGTKSAKNNRTLRAALDQYTVAASLVGFALFGALAFVLVCFFFAPT